jgi:A/G-specific adenine glycosylase
MKLTAKQIRHFQETLQAYYSVNGRFDLPWRQPERDGSFNPYKILVSEIMLQQTQVPRVIPKYLAFLTQFPTIDLLARAELSDVLKAWSGLGYNRRAKYLQEAAKQIRLCGDFPNSITELVKLPGVGKNTAGAIVAYAFNRPVVFIETNIRTVYIHHFFADKKDIIDKEILDLLEQTLDTKNPRDFYWALMDYGTDLKQKIGNLNKLSKSYKKQSAFNGSIRQLRGAVLRSLTDKRKTLSQLHSEPQDERLEAVVQALQNEGLIRRSGLYYHL